MQKTAPYHSVLTLKKFSKAKSIHFEEAEIDCKNKLALDFLIFVLICNFFHF